MTLLPPLALYVHVPWCVRKCPYCDFNSHGVGHGAELPQTEYLAALLEDLDADIASAGQRELVSLFIGGGTPSLMTADFYRDFLDRLRQRLPLAKNIEITLEANPGTLEQGRFEGYRQAGINRLSLGVQSFQTPQLKTLGRIHDGEDARRAITSAKAAGFENINIDLMHGLPGQKVSDALGDIDTALELNPTHLSWYQLTLEPNTEFYVHPPVLPQEDALWDIQDAGHQRLQQAGFSRYEISAYALPQRQARHNLNYWKFGDYLGIGAGAHGKMSYRDEAGRLVIERRWKSRQPEAYLLRRQDPRGFIAGQHEINEKELPLEFAMNALRLVEGVPLQLWEQNTGLSRHVLATRLRKAQGKGLLVKDGERLQASPQGLLFLNELLAMIDDD